jgi:integrase
MQSQGNAKAKRNPHKWHGTKYPGIEYRVRANGARTYYVNRVKVEGDLDAAKERKASIDKARRRGERLVRPAEIPKLDKLAAEWIEGKRRLRSWTKTCYESALNNVILPRFGTWLVTAIDAEAIAELIGDIERDGLHAIDRKRPKRGLSASTVNSYVLPLQGILDLAVRRGLISVNPVSLLTADERPKRRERKPLPELGEEQIAALISASEQLARQQESRYDYSHILYIASKTGLRLGELLGLLWKDIDLRAGSISVERQLTRSGELAAPKTQQAVRLVPVSTDVVARLRTLRGDVVRQPDAPVFASRTGGHLSHRNVQARGIDPAAELAGLEGFTFHKLRHAAVSRLIASGRVTPVEVAAVVGHTDARLTLSTYSHLWDRSAANESIRAAMGGASS